MAHIHTKPGQHDHTVSAFIVNLKKQKPRIILHRHKVLNKYMQIGGHIELDETPWQALIHEIKEESGYDINQLKLLQPKLRLKNLSTGDLHPYPISYSTHKYDNWHFHTDINYAFVTSEAPKYKVGDDESKELVFLTREDLLALPPKDIFEDIREISLFVIDKCSKVWEQVPAGEWEGKL